MLRLALKSLVLIAVLVGNAAAAEITQDEVERRAEAAARYLVAVESIDGHFHYEFSFLQSRFLPQDNIVRQAGAGYALNQFYYFSGKPAFAEPAARAISFYSASSVTRGPNGGLVSGDGTLAGARAGATALALLAELYHSRAIAADHAPNLRLAWLRGLAQQQLPSGGIAQSPEDTAEDSYATGETWLALATYVDLEPGNAEAVAVLARIEDYVLAKYTAEPDRQFAHWGQMAAAQRYATTRDARYVDFITGLALGYVRQPGLSNENRRNSCAALEGLISAVTTLRAAGDTATADEVATFVETAMPLNLELQLPADGTRLEFGPGSYYEDSKLATFAGAFLNGAYELQTRVDSTQHCLSALLLYRQMLGAKDWQM